jgi:hypothetical protein
MLSEAILNVYNGGHEFRAISHITLALVIYSNVVDQNNITKNNFWLRNVHSFAIVYDNCSQNLNLILS